MNPVIRDILKVVMWGLLLSLFYNIATSLDVSSQQLYMIGVVMGVLMCFVLDGLSSLIMNVGIIIKLTTSSTEDFGKFLKSIGCVVNFVPKEDEEDKNE